MTEKPAWKLSPQSAMMSYGYDPALSEGAVVCPEFHTSTFVFQSAEDGEACFSHPAQTSTLIYSRLNHPNAQIFEERLALWEDAEASVSFNSGMSAIFTLCFEFLDQSDILLYSEPVYGGSDYVFKHLLPEKLNILAVGFHQANFKEKLAWIAKQHPNRQIGMIFIETPANPTNCLVDIEICSKTAEQIAQQGKKKPLVVVDNTFLGPIFQKPLHWGADISIYSATKFLGGHSDVVAGACVGSQMHMDRLRKLRIYLGTTLGPDAASRLLRSLQTLELRVMRQMTTANQIIAYLKTQPQVEKLYTMTLLKNSDPQASIYQKQCTGPGSVFAFDVRGGKQAAFRFLNALTVFKLAVSLGSTESLAQHPYTMTHAGVPPEEKVQMGITESMIRLSIGVESPEDLLADLAQALMRSQIPIKSNGAA